MKKPKPPKSIYEVRDYIAEKGLRVDADGFWRFFAEADWYDSNGKPVLNWKQKLLTWDSYSAKPKPLTRAEREGGAIRGLHRKQERIRSEYKEYLDGKTTQALKDLKTDGGQISNVCGWLIDEILAERKGKL